MLCFWRTVAYLLFKICQLKKQCAETNPHTDCCFPPQTHRDIHPGVTPTDPNTAGLASYRVSPVELHTLCQARVSLRPPLHLLHDALDVIPGDPVEKHSSGSRAQRATAYLCLAAHHFHIPPRASPSPLPAAPRSLCASDGLGGTATHPDSQINPPAAAAAAEETETEEGVFNSRKKKTLCDGGVGFSAHQSVSPGRQTLQKNIVQSVRQTGRRLVCLGAGSGSVGGGQNRGRSVVLCVHVLLCFLSVSPSLGLRTLEGQVWD